MDGEILAQVFFNVPGDIGVCHKRRQPDLQLDPAAEKQRQKLGGKSGDRVLRGGTHGLLETPAHSCLLSSTGTATCLLLGLGSFLTHAALTFLLQALTHLSSLPPTLVDKLL